MVSETPASGTAGASGAPELPFGPLTVIVDPVGSVGEQIPVLEASLAARSLPYELLTASGAEAIGAAATDALDAGGRYLVAVGDDSTIQAVVGGMFREGRTIVEEPVLGVVPPGTGNDLVRSFGLPDDVDGACGHLAGADTYTLDVMKVTATTPAGERITRYAANLAAIGFGAEMTLRSAGRVGEGAADRRRFLAFWGAYARSKPCSITVEADTKTFEAKAYNVVVANGQFTGGLRMSPRSFPGDGLIDALVFTGPRSDAYTMLPRIFRHGDHIPDPGIKEMRAKIRVAVTTERPLRVVTDGSLLGLTPATFQVVPGQILLKI